MNKGDERIRQDWETLDNADIEEVCRLLRMHETRIQDYLVDCVAAICNVDKTDMMTNTSRLTIIHARWLFWYAYRYMTNESFIRVAEVTQRYGKKFTEQSISNSVNKMGNMIAKETTWAKRWVLVKRIIKLRNSEQKNVVLDDDLSVTINHPKNIKVKLNVINDL